MRKVHDHIDLIQLIAGRRDEGASIVNPSTARWDVSGNCESPVYREMEGRKHPHRLSGRSDEIKEAGYRITMEMDVRCRRCPPCLRARAMHWRQRCCQEMAAAKRNWFGTLTVRPESRFLLQARCRSAQTKQGVDFDALSQQERFRALCDQLNREVTLWLKRVRKRSGASLRYCLVHEAHKDGFPHVHILLHERSGTVTHRDLSVWLHGFTNFKLAEPAAAAYVTKYLAKSALARIRASLKYGTV